MQILERGKLLRLFGYSGNLVAGLRLEGEELLE
jgi:hypothetical protein